MAKAIVARTNPLTPRVVVNRLWQNHFGAGLVRTPSDFGIRSDPPTHPELLDWLANDLITSPSSWSLKRMHRQLMSSATYRQASTSPIGSDPENRWLTHANRVRLDFEATRDSLLAVTGTLNDRIGGPSIPMLDGGFQPRRTVYAYLDRENPPGLLSVFDVPSSAATSTMRDTTTVSPQALYLMNGPLAATSADLILRRPDIAQLSSVEPQITKVYQILFGREPARMEMQLASEFLGSAPTPAVWQQFLQALLLTNEFVFVD
jgi:hypothetical protein